MTIEQLKIALFEGKIIQLNCGSEKYPEWLDMTTTPEFSRPASCYRIKPHPITESNQRRKYHDM